METNIHWKDAAMKTKPTRGTGAWSQEFYQLKSVLDSQAVSTNLWQNAALIWWMLNKINSHVCWVAASRYHFKLMGSTDLLNLRHQHTLSVTQQNPPSQHLGPSSIPTFLLQKAMKIETFNLFIGLSESVWRATTAEVCRHSQCISHAHTHAHT